jgi:hypothetical protein
VIELQISAEDFKNICIGIAAILGASAPLVWARRRDPKSSDTPSIKQLPPAE